MTNFKEPKRFWSKVDVKEDIDECWEWQVGKFSSGYGSFSIHYKQRRAHRVAWVLTFGPIPEGLSVCHTCDNPGCCNPYHLFLGTQVDNLADAASKGRTSRGEDVNTSRLTKDEVVEIRELLAEGLTYQEIADMFGVGRFSIKGISRGKTWTWLG